MSMHSPLVSIIIPIYNHEKYVEEALNSVLNQTYQNLEVIIIDDGSKDQSADLADKWVKNALKKGNPYRRYTFIKQENRGAHVTINRGLSLAQGDFLTILNSDDFYHPQRIEKLVNRINEENGEFIFSAIKGIDGSGASLAVSHQWRKSYEDSLASLGLMPTVGFQLMKGNLAITTGNFLFSKNLYQRVGEFKNLILAHDYEFLLRALVITEPLFVNEELYYYRVHGDNTYIKFMDRLELELKEIYRGYLIQVSTFPPINLKAPCHWYWPQTFAFIRTTELDPSLDLFYTKPEASFEAEPNNKKINIKKNVQAFDRKQKKQKISLITHDLSLSGAPTVVVDLAKSFKFQGHSVNVISLMEGPMRKILEDYQIPIYVLPKKIGIGLFNPNGLKKNLYYLMAIFLMQFKLNKVIIGNTSHTGPLLFIFSILNPFRKLIWYLHESFPPSSLIPMKGNQGSLLDRALRNPRFELWFGSHNTKKIWENSGLTGKTMYWSGIDANNSPNIHIPKCNRMEILSVGTSCPRKGTHILIEAFINGVKSNLINENVNLTIIGFNKIDYYVGDLILYVANSGLKDRIRFIANLQPEQLEAYYQNAILYVQSSILECLPLALLKAMSLGLPIVTTDVNGCTEAIEHNKSGYLCPPRNSDLLLKYIVEALNNPAKSQELGLEAKNVFNKKFCLEVNLRDIIKELES